MADILLSRRSRTRQGVLTLMGARYLVLALIARLPFAMMVVGTLTMTVELGRSVAEGGAVSAVAGIGTAIGAPMLGRAIERFGQRLVLLVVGPAFGILLAGLAALTWLGAATGVLVLIAALTGIVGPQVAPLSRSRVAAAAAMHGSESGPLMDAAMGYESIADESAYVIGPVLVGALSILLGPCAPLLFAAGLTLTTVVAFALHPTATGRTMGAAAASPEARHPLWSFRLVLLLAGMSCIGAIFGSTITALTRALAVSGIPGWTGLVYGLMSVGSILSAASLARIPQGILPRRARWIVAGAVATAGLTLLALAPALVWTCVGLFVLGCGLGAALVSIFSSTAEQVPSRRRTTAFAMLSGALILAQAVTMAAVGELVTAGSAESGYLAAAGGGVLLVGFGVAHRLLTGSGRVTGGAVTPLRG